MYHILLYYKSCLLPTQFVCLVSLWTKAVWLVTLSKQSQWRFLSYNVMALSEVQIYRRFGKSAASFSTLNMVKACHSETSLNFYQSVVFHSPEDSAVHSPYRGSGGWSPISHGGCHARFVVDKVARGQDFVRVSRLSPVSTIPSSLLLHTRTFIYHWRYVTLAIDSVVKWNIRHQFTGTLSAAHSPSSKSITSQ